MTENEITYIVRKVLLDVHRQYGPGLYESVYEKILMVRLKQAGLSPQNQVPVYIDEDGLRDTVAFKIDILINEKVVLELKAIKQLTTIDFKQITTQLVLSGYKLGLLINFRCERILYPPGFNRIVNKL
ncbi:GxxExxY protein [Neolewinella agarilytica]|uniref:GxxExxY protein n=1 Tax=Neolewinella agarilytica TaxID=478744 RepID=A0A1H9MLA7_9BACT|nr:GxxExxY protein [Neolewinella agarilytica]SER24484.1 GxxExxY protein [Neolewinella agarilytica]